MEEEGEGASETVGVSVSGEGVESWEDLDVMEKEEEEEEEEVCKGNVSSPCKLYDSSLAGGCGGRSGCPSSR